MYAEGHANALGVGITDENFNKFVEYSNEALQDFDFTPNYKVDFIYHIDDMNPSDILEIANLKSIWGQGVEEPLIAIEGIKVSGNNIRLMAEDRNPTLKITLPNGVSLLKFRSSKEEYNLLCSELGCVTINIVGKCERNIWNGIVSPQIILENYEVVGRTEYYF
jgi:single-stranded-DNA-specific exonuclease